MRLGLLQLTSGPDMAENISHVLAAMRMAADKGADLVTTPETTHLMDMDKARMLKAACLEADDPGLAAFCALAAELGIWLHIGSLVIRLPSGRLVNRAFVIDPQGRIKARYDKIHLFDVKLSQAEQYRESALYDPGADAVLVDIGAVRFGLSVCYDVRFPALYRAMAEKGATVLLVPAAFSEPTGRAHWEILLRARAIENGAYVIAAAQTGEHGGGRRTYGHSMVVGPWGDVLLDAGVEPGVHVFDLDLGAVADARARIPSLSHGRSFRVKLLGDI